MFNKYSLLVIIACIVTVTTYLRPPCHIIPPQKAVFLPSLELKEAPSTPQSRSIPLSPELQAIVDRGQIVESTSDNASIVSLVKIPDKWGHVIIKQANDNSEAYVANQCIVKLSNDTQLPILTDICKRYNATYEINDGIFMLTFKQTTLSSLDGYIDAIQEGLHPEYIAKNNLVFGCAFPSDPLFNNQDYCKDPPVYPSVNIRKAWDKSKCNYNVKVAIIDSGLDYNHSDIRNQIWKNSDEIPDNGIDDDNNGFIDDIKGWDFSNNDNDGYSMSNHGTHTAGIIAAETNNGIGIAGVAWNVKILNVKVLNDYNVGTEYDVVQGIKYADHCGFKIINISVGGTSSDLKLYNDMLRNLSSDCFLVCSAGNDNRDLDNSGMKIYPACLDDERVFSIGGYDQIGRRYSYSNYGATEVDIFAPAKNIYSCLRNSNYGCSNGTSGSAAFVTGALCLLKAQHPSITPSEFRSRLISTATSMPLIKGLCVGNGGLDINALLDDSPVPPPSEDDDDDDDDDDPLSLDAPVITNPSNNDFLPPGNTYIDWLPVDNARSYDIVISLNGNELVNTEVFDKSWNEELEEGTYTVKVRARNKNITSDWSSEVTFELANDDIYEENDNANDAQRLPSPIIYGTYLENYYGREITHNLMALDDDYFTIYLDKNYKHTITFDGNINYTFSYDNLPYSGSGNNTYEFWKQRQSYVITIRVQGKGKYTIYHKVESGPRDITLPQVSSAPVNDIPLTWRFNYCVEAYMAEFRNVETGQLRVFSFALNRVTILDGIVNVNIGNKLMPGTYKLRMYGVGYPGSYGQIDYWQDIIIN